MQKFLVLYMTPSARLEEWLKTDPKVREKTEADMKEAWNAWMEQHGGQLIETAGAGKAKRVTAAGSEDAKNDIMLVSIMEAESPEDAAAALLNHPHLGIPDSWIEIMPMNQLPAT